MPPRTSPPIVPDADVTPRPFQDDQERARAFRDLPEDVSPTSRGSASWQRDVRQWYMIVREATVLFDRGHRISGQFTPQQVSENSGANIPEAGGYGRLSPIIQWVGGKVDSFTFQARLFSNHRDDSTAAEKLEEIKLLKEPESTLGRPPLVSFFWGEAIPDGFDCFIESIGGISYDEIRLDGTLRGVTLSLTLKRWTPWQFEQVVTNPAEQTPRHIVVHGETYEMIALREYGDPMMGVVLRQLNPRSPMVKKAPRGVADLQPGEEVKIFPLRDMRRKRVRPMCHVLRQDNRIAADNRRYFFELRSTEVGTIPRR